MWKDELALDMSVGGYGGSFYPRSPSGRREDHILLDSFLTLDDMTLFILQSIHHS